MRKDYVAIIEASYRPAADETAWLRGVVEAARPLIDRGLGIRAYTYSIDATGRFHPSTPIDTDMPPDRAAMVTAITRVVSDDPVATSLVSSTAASTMSHLGTTQDSIRAGLAVCAEYGIRDWFGLNAREPDGRGCSVVAPLPVVTRLARHEIRAWSRVSAHLGAGRRLLAASAPVAANDLEAVLSPTGKLLHAHGSATLAPAREALRDAARNIDRARGSMRHRDAEGAVEIWEGLVAGRWSLVDQFDTDGRRYLVARRNDPDVRGPSALSERERQVLGYAALGHSGKLIAYELGLAQSTVATHLASAARKLGARTRVELVQLARSLPVETTED